MKPVRITWKSSLPLHEFGWGIEYRVMFENIPKYLKKEWLKYADGVCVDEEKANPKIEMNAVLCSDGSLKNVYFQYYFDDYKSFTLKASDVEKVIKLFVEYVKQNDNNLLDAYDCETEMLMGEVEWEEKAYQ